MDVSRPVLEWAALPSSRCDALSSVILGNPRPFHLQLCPMHCSSSLLRFGRVCVLSCHLTHSSWMLRSIFSPSFMIFSLAFQFGCFLWPRLQIPLQETRVQLLGREDPLEKG